MVRHVFQVGRFLFVAQMHSLKLAAKAPENGWLKDVISFWVISGPIFNCELFFSGGYVLFFLAQLQ